MRLAGCSVPKMNPEHGRRDGISDGLLFCRVQEGVRAFLEAHAAGKALFVSDGGSYSVFAPISLRRAVFAVLDTADALPLFLMPDEVSCVLAAGSRETLVAARVFASVRGVPCALFPTDAALDGALSGAESACISGVCAQMELPAAEIFIDPICIKRSLAGAYCRLLLAQLALIEERAVSLLTHRARCENFESVYGSLLHIGSTAEEIVTANARMRIAESEGFPVGEGVTLAKMTGGVLPEWRAFRTLSALYSAFFKRGRPRRYFIADYMARCAVAGAEYGAQVIPTTEEYAQRALTLEKFRAELTRETAALSRAREGHLRTVRTLAGSYFDETGDCPLKILPERAPGGLTALVRDFGLMEEL